MHRNPIPGVEPGTPEDAFDAALLALLTDGHGGHWSVSELARALTSSSQAGGGDEAPRHEIEDAIERLYAAGLIHRVGQFVFASRAAHAAQRLAS